jgi:transposase InsO family protein
MQLMPQATSETDGVLGDGRILICDRDPRWTRGMQDVLEAAGVRVVRTPASAPNCNAHAERFVRTIKHECLNRIVPLGERHLRRTLRDFTMHYHGERNHHGIGNELIDTAPVRSPGGRIRRRQRIGGVLSYYYRSAA